MAWYMKQNGIRHKVTVDETGNKVYDPPLPVDPNDKKRLKEMLESGQAPGANTDTGFHSGRGTLLDQMGGDENWTKHLVKEARKKGYNPGANDVYISQLADSTGDPKAFIKPGDGRAQVERICKERNFACESPTVSVKAKQVD